MIQFEYYARKASKKIADIYAINGSKIENRIIFENSKIKFSVYYRKVKINF
jgi:hypothetical protein